MTQQEAINTVTSQRRQLQIGAGMEVVSAEKAIVEYTKDRNQPGCVENRVAWIVTLGSSRGLVEVRVADESGEVLEVIR